MTVTIREIKDMLKEEPEYTFKRFEEGGKLIGQVNDLQFAGISKEHSRMAMPINPNSQDELAALYAKLKSGRYAPGGRPVRIRKAKS